MKLRALATTALVAAMSLGMGAATAATTKLRIQTHYAPETPSGKLAQQFFNDLTTMSNGEIQVEAFFSSSVVKTVETFDAAATGILDCDMTGGGYQTGKNPAFQFVGDIMGGYDTPYQQLSWLYYGGGLEAAQKLYNKYDMQLIGWWVYGQESLASSKALKGIGDLKDFKFTTVVFLRRLPFFQEKLVQGALEHADVSLDNAILPVGLSGTHGNLDGMVRAVLEELVSLEATFRVDM